MLLEVTPAATSDLTTVTAACLEIGTTDIARVAALIAQASGACAGFCGRNFGLATCVETFFRSSYPLVLSRFPVVTVTSIVEMGTALTPADFALNPLTGMVYRSQDPAWDALTVSVTYQAGFLLPGLTTPADGGPSAPPLPPVIERACLEVVKALWFASGQSVRDPAVRSETIDGIGSTSYLDPIMGNGGLPALAAALLSPFKKLGA